MQSSVTAAHDVLRKLYECFAHMRQNGLTAKTPSELSSTSGSPLDVWNALRPEMLEQRSPGCVWFTIEDELRLVQGGRRLRIFCAPTTAALSDYQYADSCRQFPTHVLEVMRHFDINAEWDGNPLSHILVSTV
jgi:hypothetical protein